MKLTKRHLKRIIREEYNKVRQEQRILKESYYKNLFIEIEDFIIYLSDSYGGTVPIERVVELLKKEFDHFSLMNPDQIRTEPVSYTHLTLPTRTRV